MPPSTDSIQADLPSRPNLTPAEVAEFLHIKVSTVYQMADAAQIPAFKLGRLWRIPRESFLVWYQKKLPTENFPSV